MKKNNLKILFFILLAITNIAGLYAQEKDDVDEYLDLYRKGVTYYNDDKYLEALNSFQKMEAYDCSIKEPYTAIYAALLCKELNWYGSAIAYFEKAIEYDNDFRMLGNLGAIYSEMGEDDMGLKYLDRALSEDPDYAFALSNKGAVQMGQGKLDEALSNLRKALDNDADRILPQLYSNMSNVFDLMDQPDSALFYINKSLEVAPNFNDALVTKRKLIDEYGENDEAYNAEYEALNKQIVERETIALSKNPNNFKSLYNRAFANMEQGNKKASEVDFKRAESILTTLIELHPSAAAFLEKRARIYRHLGNKEAAIKDYSRILELNRLSPEAQKYINKNKVNE